MYGKLIYLVLFVLVLSVALTNVAKAMDPNLVGGWRLDEGSGTTTADFSGNGNDGTLQGDTTWVTGQIGKALHFDGVDDFVEVPHAEILTVDNEVTVMAWINAERLEGPAAIAWQGILGKGDSQRSYSFYTTVQTTLHFSTAGVGTRSFGTTPLNEWIHVCAMVVGGGHQYYINGEPAGTAGSGIKLPGVADDATFVIGRTNEGKDRSFQGTIDDVRIYNRGLKEEEVRLAMFGATQASNPDPANGSLHENTSVSLSWDAGDFAVSHDVYLGDNFDDVNDGTGETSRGNQTDMFFTAGSPGNPFPDGLVPGITYYWRIDEVNDLHPDSPWKGEIWSFTVPPKTAFYPDPADGAEFVDLNVQLKWTAGFGATLHYIVFGEDFDEVNNAAMGVPNSTANYNPGPLRMSKTYYWRVDEFDDAATHKGEVWSFTTLGGVSDPNPADGSIDVKPTVVLSWDAGAVAASHEVYLGTDADAVANATTTSPEYMGAKALGKESYDPGLLTLNTAYYWRIDEVNGVNPDSPWAGDVWSFTTSDFFVIDDCEDYDTGDNQIWFAWHDGLGAGTQGTPGYIPGNGTGSAVGDDTTLSYTEETIVNGGLQSMPLVFDNNIPGSAYYSEVEHTLSAVRDWTAEGVTELSLWFRGYPAFAGSFVEGPAGTYTMTGSGHNIGGTADGFHYAYKLLTGKGSITARVESVQNTNEFARAGVMIRWTLTPGSKHAFTNITPRSGVAFTRRETRDADSFTTPQKGIIPPYWLKLERSISGSFTASHSMDGTTWEMVTGTTPLNIQMPSKVYIGLALTSHNTSQASEAVFSNVTTTGNVSGEWANEDIGVLTNDPELLYVAVSNSAGTPAVMVHDDPAASTIDTWTEWVIPLQDLADQGIVLTNVDRIAIGLGTKGNITTPGGLGKMFFDDIRLNRPREAAE